MDAIAVRIGCDCCPYWMRLCVRIQCVRCPYWMRILSPLLLDASTFCTPSIVSISLTNSLTFGFFIFSAISQAASSNKRSIIISILIRSFFFVILLVSISQVPSFSFGKSPLPQNVVDRQNSAPFSARFLSDPARRVLLWRSVRIIISLSNLCPANSGFTWLFADFFYTRPLDRAFALL